MNTGTTTFGSQKTYATKKHTLPLPHNAFYCHSKPRDFGRTQLANKKRHLFWSRQYSSSVEASVPSSSVLVATVFFVGSAEHSSLSRTTCGRQYSEYEDTALDVACHRWCNVFQKAPITTNTFFGGDTCAATARKQRAQIRCITAWPSTTPSCTS